MNTIQFVSKQAVLKVPSIEKKNKTLYITCKSNIITKMIDSNYMISKDRSIIKIIKKKIKSVKRVSLVNNEYYLYLFWISNFEFWFIEF